MAHNNNDDAFVNQAMAMLQQRMNNEPNPHTKRFVVRRLPDGRCEVLVLPQKRPDALRNVPRPAGPKKFPNRLPSLGVCKADLGLQPELRASDSAKPVDFRVGDEDKAALEALGLVCDPLTCFVSPSRCVNLPDKAREAANIPTSAQTFAWTYPAVRKDGGGDGESPNVEGMSPLALFFFFGGFVYFDAQGVLVAANAVTQGKALLFGPPEQWDNALTAALKRDGRCQPLTIKHLRDQGAKYFCWLVPGEQIGTDEHGTPKTTEFGAFLYLFGEEPTDQDRLFPVLQESNEEAELVPFQSAQESNRSITICDKCKIKSRCMLFLNCNHLLFCEECAHNVRRCPACGALVARAVKTFMS